MLYFHLILDARFRFYHHNILEPHFLKQVKISNYQEIKLSLLNEKKIDYTLPTSRNKNKLY